MDINTIVLIIILAVILYAMVTNNQSKSQQAKELREQIIAEKETISKEEVATYGQVQDRKDQLIKLIDTNLSEHPKESDQLKGIVDEIKKENLLQLVQETGEVLLSGLRELEVYTT